MKKECLYCQNFSVFYSKIGLKYIQTTCGRCWTHKDICGCNETCDKWEANPVNKQLERQELLKALENAVTEIGTIKEALTEK